MIGAMMGASPGEPSPAAPQLALLLQASIALVLITLLAKLAFVALRVLGRTSAFVYTPFSASLSERVLVVDCTHPHARTLTHHKGGSNPPRLVQADTSTGLVLNAIKVGAWNAGPVWTWAQLPAVSTNHFDVDSFLSVWCYLNRSLALQHEAVLRHTARIGDFREAFLSPELVSRHGAEDGLKNVRDAFTALKLCCWLNSVERARFSAPYETKDCDAKFAYFLPRFGAVLANPEAVWEEWQDEYKQVVSGYDLLTAEPPAPSVERYPAVGLVVLRCAEPQHYYALFSHTVGYDTVLSMYDGQRYEVEAKYTQFVNVHSRPVWPRVDMAPLARVLNRMEGAALGPQLRWTCARFTDTGPVLRIEDGGRPLSKAQRYGHPTARPLHGSSLSPATLAALVVSFLEYGMQGLKPKRGGWSWDELQSLNAGIAWQSWEDTVLRQWERGELDPGQGPHELLGRPSTDSLSGSITGASPRLGTVLSPTGFWQPALAEPSAILSPDDVRSLAGAVPARLAGSARWQLLYGSSRDGISLRTLYRKAAGRAPTLLVVREAGGRGHVFGAFATEAWKPGPRFYGTGETFVFTLHPSRVKYGWQRPTKPQHPRGSSGGGALPHPTTGGTANGTGAAALHHLHPHPANGDGDASRYAGSPSLPPAAAAAAEAAAAAAGPSGMNDWFQFSTHEGLGVGGSGRFALWLDNELDEGSSAPCDTFGSPRLASREEFHVAAVELWLL